MAALENRADLQAALLNKDIARKAVTLTRKERRGSIDLKIGYANYFSTDGITPKTTGLTAGIGIPLKFSNINKGEITMAEIKVRQADEQYKQAELLIRTEIIQAWEMYQSYSKQVKNYNNGLLENAENVRRGKIYSYQRGETSLLEVLNAQRTYNDVQTTYYETVFNQAASLIELERAAGIWDINF
jgi:cobalt-zinc-cadmium efflux system outer membrane protein